MNNKEIASAMHYDNRIFRIAMSNLFGDKVDVKVPVKAAKKLLDAAGSFPVMPKGVNAVEMAQFLSAAADCLEAGMEGDLVNASMADGTRIRIFIE